MNLYLLAVELAALDPLTIGVGVGGVSLGGVLAFLAQHVFSSTVKDLKANTAALQGAQQELVRLHERLNALADQVAQLAGAQKAMTELMAQVRGHDVMLVELRGDIQQMNARLEQALNANRAA